MRAYHVGMAPPREHSFPDPDSLADALATAVEKRLSAAAMQRGQALIGLSGGRSPIPLFERLSSARLDWSRVTVTQVDERWVAPDNIASNSRVIREHLLRGPASAARFLALRNDAASASEGQPVCEAMLNELPLPFDVTLL